MTEAPDPHPVINAAFSTEAVRAAMQDAWNDICSDTGCHPLDIKHGRGKFLTFEPGHWAEAVARHLFANYVKATLDDDRLRRCTHCGFIVDLKWKAEFEQQSASERVEGQK